jgi:D-arabinose 1-dehydrogenase-like Zn-dependent alcohol dehydrogenase
MAGSRWLATRPGQTCIISGFGGAGACARASEHAIKDTIIATSRTIDRETFIVRCPAAGGRQ